MRSEKDVEAYLLRLGRQFRAVDDTPGMFLVEAGSQMPPSALRVALRVEAPLVVVRVSIGDVPKSKELSNLFRKLLELNAQALVHASYGLDGDRIVLTSALELENLDFNELGATLDEIDFALAQQVPVLLELSKA